MSFCTFGGEMEINFLHKGWRIISKNTLKKAHDANLKTREIMRVPKSYYI